jgi:hypothetical protein
MRPRLCAVCYGAATLAIEELRPTTVIKRDGAVHRGFQPVLTYYCDEHCPQ